MTSKKGNRKFLCRINKILGKRPKHPWGDALGLKNTRIQSIFQGQIPTSDALEIIHRAEKVRVDWLLTGEGPPFLVMNWLSEDEVVQKLLSELASDSSIQLYLLTDGCGNASFVTTQPMVREYEWGAVSHFIDVYVYPYVSWDAVEALIDHCDMRLIRLDKKSLSDVSVGWKGPVDLLDGILKHYVSIEGEGASLQIKEATGFINVQGRGEVELLNRFRQLKSGERDALMTVVGAMVTSNGSNLD